MSDPKAERQKAERSYRGAAASPGLVIGPLVRITAALRTEDTESESPEHEQQRLLEALESARDQLRGLAAEQDEETAAILEFQIEMTGDEELLAEVIGGIAAGDSASRAWWSCLEAQIDDFHAADDDYFQARASDLTDLRDRVAGLLGALQSDDAELPDGTVILDEDLTPTRFLGMDWKTLGGIALTRGSISSHVAMLARSRGVPMVTGLGEAPAVSDQAILDSHQGVLITDPAGSTLELYDKRLQAWQLDEAAATEALARPAVTRDGDAVALMINVDHPDVVADDVIAATEGVGLMRTEFLYMNRAKAPNEQTQYETYCVLADRLQGKPCVIRTLDIGGDKPVAGLTAVEESNPFLGLRGIRLTLDAPDIFRPQVRALLRTASNRAIKVMLPMIATPAEYRDAQAFFETELECLETEGVDAAMPPLGIMVETPACAVAIDTFDAAFYSIGSNDLTQYVMAAARDGGGRVAALNDPSQPAVLRLIQTVVEHGRKTGRPVSLCGDMGSEPAMIPLLLELGLDTISVAPAAAGRAKLAVQGFQRSDKRHSGHG